MALQMVWLDMGVSNVMLALPADIQGPDHMQRLDHCLWTLKKIITLTF